MKEKNQENQNQDKSQEVGDLYEVRLEKLQTMIDAGRTPYHNRFKPSSLVSQALSMDESKWDQQNLTMGGRIRSRRIMGRAGFWDIEDESGRMQFYASRNDSESLFDEIKTYDIGDIVGIEGFLFRTKTGQVTLHVKDVRLLAKCIRPLPVVKEADGKTFDAFADKEQRYRMRYVDLIVNPSVRQTFILRSRIVAWIRSYLTSKGYLEVETPMMHPIPGGATARPFQTHHNALDMDLYLRIAPELYLKRLIVGGFSKVFEINRNFRNEGISYKHNPEFTMLELYEAYGDMQSMMNLCESLITELTFEIHEKHIIPYGDATIDLTPPWKRMSYLESVETFAKVKLDPSMSLDEALKETKKAKLKLDFTQCTGVWSVAEKLFDEFVEPKLIQPTFITDYPVELSPLAKVNPDRPGFVERFEPYIAGREIANAFSELNDPIDQKARFEMQVALRESGNEEGGYMDNDYVRALEYGMPPAGGMGIGIDRLVMLLTDSHSIRDTILFPLMRPE